MIFVAQKYWVFVSLVSFCVTMHCEVVMAQNSQESHQPLIAKVRPSIATIRVQGRDGKEMGIGTGFAVATDLIATNYHVINEGRRFSVRMADGQDRKVLAVEASDAGNDLVLIRVEVTDEPLVPLELATEESEQGMRVLAFASSRGTNGPPLLPGSIGIANTSEMLRPR